MIRVFAGFFFILCLTTASPAEVKVEKVVSTNADHFLGGYVRLKIGDLEGLIKEGIENVRLQLSGKVLTDSRATASAVADGTIEFPLVRSANDQSAWNWILGSPPLSGEKMFRVSIVKAGGSAYPGAQEITFRIFDQFWLIVACIICLLTLGLLLYLGATTNMLRDGLIPVPPQSKSPSQSPTILRPFSLGRCQMAFWLFLITSAFLFIWVITGQYNGILTPDSLILLGISSTTGLAAIAVDRTKGAQGLYTPAAKQCFLTDILYADGGPALHRVQLLIWTIILGAVFVRATYISLQLPQFDTTLLTMIGISGGLYIGFKFPEQKKGG